MTKGQIVINIRNKAEILTQEEYMTLTEAAEAVERYTKKPHKRGSCPNCGRLVRIQTARYDFCPDCGQAIKHEEEKK